MVITETKVDYTTVCPVAAAAAASTSTFASNTPIAPGGSKKVYTSIVSPSNSTTPVAPVTVLQTKTVVPIPALTPAGTTIATLPIPTTPIGGGVKEVATPVGTGAAKASGTGAGAAKPSTSPFVGAAARGMGVSLGWSALVVVLGALMVL